MLVFESSQTIARFEKMGDLFEPVLELKQKLPDLKAAVAKEPAAIEIAAQAGENHPERKPASTKSAKKSTAPRKRAKV